MSNALRDVGRTIVATPQSEQATPEQVRNAAGGFVFAVTPQTQLRRFLILGTEGGTFYANERQHTLDNVKIVHGFAADPVLGLEMVAMAAEVSDQALAKSNKQAEYALAVAASSPHQEVRRAALLALPKVARTATHLYEFSDFALANRGAGMGLRKAWGRWLTERDAGKLAYQAVKYRQREGWDLSRILRMAHTGAYRNTATPAQAAVFEFILGRPNRKAISEFPELRVIEGFLWAQDLGDKLTAADAVALVTEYGLPWEALPDHVRQFPEVWQALLPGMGATALVRNLPTMTRLGALDDRAAKLTVKANLADDEWLARNRIHPLQILNALYVYRGGHSLKGSSTWTPLPWVVDALDGAFYKAFKAVTPTGKRHMLALDVSGSMSMAGSKIADTALYAREASVAMAMVTNAVEENVETVAFTSSQFDYLGRDTGLTSLDISPRRRLDDVIAETSRLRFGRTDCALPMIGALQNKVEIDTFVIYTDNETWHGHIHPFQALREYRRVMGIPAKLIVVGMTSTGFSIADPSDAGMLDVVGFDSSAPATLADFAAGRL